MIISTWLLLVAAAATASMLLPKKYESHADIVVDLKTPDTLTGGYVPAMMMSSFMGTQIDLVKSRKVADRVIDSLRLDKNPQFITAWNEQTDGVGDIRSWLFGALSGNLTVVPSRNSSLFTITFSASDPQGAAAVANAYAQAYVQVVLDMKVSPAGENASWFKDRLQSLRDEVDQAQATLSDFRREKGIVGDTRGRLDTEAARLNDMAGQLTAAQAIGADIRSRGGASRDLETLPEVMQNPLIQNIRIQINEARAKLQESASRLGPNHPEYKRLTVQLSELETQLNTQMERVKSSLSVMSAQGSARVGSLQQSMNDQRKKVINLNADMDRMAVLQHQLDAAEAAYLNVSQRYTQTNLESQTTSTNINVVSPAVPALSPTSPNVLLNLVAAIFLGMILGCAGAVAVELGDRRVRTALDFDIGVGLPLPLLGVVPAVSRREVKIDRQIEKRQGKQLSGPSSAALPSG